MYGDIQHFPLHFAFYLYSFKPQNGIFSKLALTLDIECHCRVASTFYRLEFFIKDLVS